MRSFVVSFWNISSDTFESLIQLLRTAIAATGVDDASNPPRTIDHMPSSPATGFVASSRVDQGVASNGRQPPEGRSPPTLTGAAPHLRVEQLLQLVIMEGVAMNSKLERLEKENLYLIRQSGKA
jgi:hypothetical protein